MRNSDFKSGRESLHGVYLMGEVVEIVFNESHFIGEAKVRISELHGEGSSTKDGDLPTALFYSKAFPESFGTLAKGDKVVVSFIQGSRLAPMIEGRVTDLDALAQVVPEYKEKYGKVHGIYSKAIGGCVFFDEDAKSLVLRIKDGSVITLVKDKISATTDTLDITTNKGCNIISQGDTKVTSKGNISLDAQGELLLKSATAISLKAPIINEN